jgi:hypothetical protein
MTPPARSVVNHPVETCTPPKAMAQKGLAPRLFAVITSITRKAAGSSCLNRKMVPILGAAPSSSALQADAFTGIAQSAFPAARCFRVSRSVDRSWLIVPELLPE